MVTPPLAEAALCASRTTDPTALIDDDIDVLVEAIGGTTTARTLVETTLRPGIGVVTANKALLAQHGPQLTRLARSNGATPLIRSGRSRA